MSKEEQEAEDVQMALMDQEITSLLPKIKAGKKLVDMLDRDCLKFDVTMSKVCNHISPSSDCVGFISECSCATSTGGCEWWKERGRRS